MHSRKLEKSFPTVQHWDNDSCIQIGGGCDRALVLCNFQGRSVLLIWIIVGQGPTVLEVGSGGGCLDICCAPIISLFFLFLSGRQLDIE